MINRRHAIIVEDFSLIAEAWKRVLSSLGFEEIEIHTNAERLINLDVKDMPDLFLMDINLKNSLNGIEITQMLMKKSRDIKIIIVSMHNESFFVKSALDAGARGYVTKNSPMEELELGIEKVLSGEIFKCSEIDF